MKVATPSDVQTETRIASETQENRELVLHGTLADSGLRLQFLHADEALNQPFTYQLDLIGDGISILSNDVLGKPTCVTYDTPDTGGRQSYHGYITEFTLLDASETVSHYRASLRPWLWFLSRNTDWRIFQNQNVEQIIRQVFDPWSKSDFTFKLGSHHSERGYVVQADESDFAFVSRLMEGAGIHYYFEHTGQAADARHTMVMTDATTGFPKAGPIRFIPKTPDNRHEVPHINRWSDTGGMVAEKVVTNDYDFEVPNKDLEARGDIKGSPVISGCEVFLYPGGYSTPAQGNDVVRTLSDSIVTPAATAHGGGDDPRLRPGISFELVEHPLDDRDGTYLVTAASSWLRAHAYITSDPSQPGKPPFACRFHAVDLQRPHRPTRVTPKPVLTGPQTARVVGPEGEEIHVDTHGRVKVHFHWDRKGSKDENSSCWLRVAEGWAGKHWGGQFPPRIGDEVIVSFLDGDPDRPIVTGRLYNGSNQPPFSLPDQRTRSGIRSRSTKEGNEKQCNELSFEDSIDAERVTLHAERDFEQAVENDASYVIGVDKADPGNLTIKIQNDRSTTLHQGDDALTVEKGDRHVAIDAGSNTLEAAKFILLKVGGSSLKIEPTQVTIETTKLILKGEASVDVNGAVIKIAGDASVDVEAPKTAVRGSAMAEVSGALVKIN